MDEQIHLSNYSSGSNYFSENSRYLVIVISHRNWWWKYVFSSDSKESNNSSGRYYGYWLWRYTIIIRYLTVADIQFCALIISLLCYLIIKYLNLVVWCVGQSTLWNHSIWTYSLLLWTVRVESGHRNTQLLFTRFHYISAGKLFNYMKIA